MDLRERLFGASCFMYEKMFSQEMKREAMQKFLELDADGDGLVSMRELSVHMGGASSFLPSFFRVLDVDNSGSLNFDECKALFFLFHCYSVWASSAFRFCDACYTLLVDEAYTCQACLALSNVYFDLCCNCSPDAHYHGRSQFVTQELMVGSVIDTTIADSIQATMVPSSSHHHHHTHYHYHGGGTTSKITTITKYDGSQKRESKTSKALQVVGAFATTANVLSSCSIM